MLLSCPQREINSLFHVDAMLNFMMAFSQESGRSVRIPRCEMKDPMRASP